MGEIPDCAHRDRSPEAYSIDPLTGRETPITVYLCNWPDAHPAHFVDAPRWLQKKVYPGLAIMPETDCINCPGRALSPSSSDGER